MYSTHTSSSYSPSISDGTITPNSLHHHHHHHQQQQQQHLTMPPHLPFPNSASGYDEDLQTQRLQRQKTNGTLDGADYDSNINDNDNDNEEHSNERNHKNDTTKLCEDNNEGDKNPIVADNKSTTNIHESGEEHQIHPQQQQHHHHHPLKRHGRHHRYAEHALRIPSKLRKIDRDSTVDNDGTAVACNATASGAGGVGGVQTNAVKFDKLTGDGIKSGSNAASADGSYQCQFCDKSFPRLGYLKKHEQVSKKE